MTWGETGRHAHQIEEALNLKICDLCGALNLISDQECVVCRWHGHFERRPHVVRMALELQMDSRIVSEARIVLREYDLPKQRGGGLGARLAAVWSSLCTRLLPKRF